MSYLTLFPTRRSQPISRDLVVSHPLWRSLSAFDDILRDFDDSFHESRFAAEENDTSYTFTVALPGFKRTDIEVEVQDEGYLTVTAQRGGGIPKENQVLNPNRIVSRTVALPTDADPTKVETKLEDGLLAITIQKTEQVKPRKVTVN